MKQKMKRLTSVLLALVMALGMLPFMSMSAYAATVLIGDVDGNGTVNKADSILLDRYVANWTGHADKVNMDAADVNRDGNVNKADAILLARYIANWTVESQIGQTVEVGEPEELKIVEQPLDVEFINNVATLSITVSGIFDSITYDWQKETPSGWRKVSTLNSDDATYTVNNSALQIISKNGTEGIGKYRCIVSAFNGGKPVAQVESRAADVDPQAAPMKAFLSLGKSAGRDYYYFYATGHSTGEIDPELGYLYEETTARIFKNYATQARFEEATEWIVGEPDWYGPPGDENYIAGFWIREGRLKGGPYMADSFKDASGNYMKNENGEYVTNEAIFRGRCFTCSINSLEGGKGPYTYTWYLSKDRFGEDFQPLIEGKNCIGQGTENIMVWPFEPGKGNSEPYFMGFLCCRITDSKGRTTNATYYRYKYGSYHPGYMYNYPMLYAFNENAAWFQLADACWDNKPGHVHRDGNSADSCCIYNMDNQGIGRWW